jgi:inorganic pyrophosphatase/exopolyphosphatase
MKESSLKSEGQTNLSLSKVENLFLKGSNKLDPWVITPYHWPDIDGIASAIALEEFLVQVGYSHVQAMIWQAPQIEAGWVIKELGLSIPDLTLSGNENIILVDASDPADIPSFVNPAQIKVVIDHREYHELECFPSAIRQIETVGAAATLFSEFFRNQSLVPSVSGRRKIIC